MRAESPPHLSPRGEPDAALKSVGLRLDSPQELCTASVWLNPPDNSLTDSVSAAYPGDVLFYGVVSGQTEKVAEFFLEREAAEAMIGEVRAKRASSLTTILRVPGLQA
jgi:hypothetical protein